MHAPNSCSLLSVRNRGWRLLPVVMAAFAGSAAPTWAAPVEGRVLADLAAGPRAPVIILLADQADLAEAARMTDASRRGWYVYRTLRDHAERSQAGVRALLDRRGAAHRSFWAVSAIATTVDAALLRELAARPDVRAVESDAETRWLDTREIADVTSGSGAGNGYAEWGADSVGAPAAWALGYNGEGIVVASADTGVDWTHPALTAHYRGWNGVAARHDYSWHDSIHDSVGNPCGNDARAPCDDVDHGTHTTGIMVGDDGLENRIGVAPGARWIACRNMDHGDGRPARYLECMEFFLAPTDLAGANPDPDLRPHVINNSWVCPGGEGCAAITLEGLVENMRADGIFFVASAGNAGPGCSTITDPPAIYRASFTVGAYDAGGVIAGFSSRGPVLVDDTGRTKPDLAAPGVGVRSSIPGGGYASFSGTSMAGPHVAGVVALLWSAHPELARLVDETRATLSASAAPVVFVPAVESCGDLTSDFSPNNTFGRGRVDALRAIQW